MALSMLVAQADSGFGNIRASPGSPSRNIDWVLLLRPGALSIIGLFIIYSASYTQVRQSRTCTSPARRSS